jgi:hypothetical protein
MGKRRSTKQPPLPRGMRQLALPVSAPAKSDEAFIAYHHANPEVYAAFKQIAERLYRRGVQHYGAKAIMEVVRYRTIVRGDDGFKVNNNYTSRYARLLMAEDPRFAQFFELRVLKSEAA